MKITGIKTHLVDASLPGGWSARNWCFVTVETDEGITGIGEASGWPRVIQTAIQDLTPTLLGEDPGRIERLWQKMLLAIMGHGMTGVVGAGAMTGIEIALWDILGKKLGVPICDLLGGRCRDWVPVDALAKVAAGISLLRACGERSSTIYGFRELIEREIADVIQPDMGRAGGFAQMKKIAGQAEAHHIMVAPHDGSAGPVAEAAAVHLLAAIPNCLILEHLADDVPWRYDVATELPVKQSQIAVPTKPGLGIELNEAVCSAHPSRGNVTAPSSSTVDAMYVQSRTRRRRLFQVR